MEIRWAPVDLTPMDQTPVDLTPVGLTPVAERRRGHGAMQDVAAAQVRRVVPVEVSCTTAATAVACSAAGSPVLRS
ncbi:hypothetical protein [Streptomyces sp. NPDC047071]|uniref:hypothetical protein n=1 Tax=Streptomyces sp. NPDC047071 TaxID=3154808 RepID=UPI00345189B1